MNTNGHKRFMARVVGYRRSRVFVDQATLSFFHSNHLLEPGAVIRGDGIGDGIVLTYCSFIWAFNNSCITANASASYLHHPYPSPVAKMIHKDQKRMGLQNYKLSILAGQNSSKLVTVYTPFLGYGLNDWWPVQVKI